MSFNTVERRSKTKDFALPELCPLKSMSLAKRTASHAATAAVAAIALIAIASLYPAPSVLPPQRNSSPSIVAGSSQGQTITQQVISTSATSASQTNLAQTNGTAASLQALLLVQLTDPPAVPAGTTSLNLTYSAINLIVSEPGTGNQVTTSNIAITPTGGSATVDLLRLQNVSQTIATAGLPTGSTIYSVSFTVAGMSIDVNGTTSAATLATGGNSFEVTLVKPIVVQSTTAALLELNPIVANTPTGYQVIPSAMGVTRPSSEITDQDHDIGWRHQLTDQDKSDLGGARGQVSARLVELSATGVTTTVTVQVNNTGSSPVQLQTIGLDGGFVRDGPGCTTATTSTSTTSTSSTTTSATTSEHGQGDQNNGHGNGNNNGNSHSFTFGCNAWNEVIFVPQAPVTSTTTSSSTTSTSASPCTASSMGLILSDKGTNGMDRGLTLAPGECVVLTFTGTISFGGSFLTIVPATTTGTTYSIHVVASNGAEATLNCVLPLSKTSCIVDNPQKY